MFRTQLFAVIPVLFLGCSALATPSLAALNADFQTCALLDGQVYAAIRSSTGDTKEASNERRKGAEFCHRGFYRNGVDHYKKALQLLGQ